MDRTASLPVEQADRIIIIKSERTMTLIDQQVLKSYKVALGHEPRGPKQRQGDNRTPEGEYTIDHRPAQSPQPVSSLAAYFVSQPGRPRARSEAWVDPGGAIMIHGLPVGYAWPGAAHRQFDWTLGSIAVTNAEIEEIWKLVPLGTKVEIKP